MENKKIFSVNPIIFYLFLILYILSSITLVSSCTSKQSGTPFDFPKPDGYVNDYTDTLSKSWIQKTEQLAIDLEEETTCEIAVAVIDNLDGFQIEEYSVSLFNLWSIGKEENDNGILLLIALKERELRIEVGYGLEGTITDIEAKDIIDNVIVPRFKENDYNSGIYNGVIAIVNKIYNEQDKNQLAYSDNVDVLPDESFFLSPVFIITAVIILIIVGFILIPFLFGGAIAIPSLIFYRNKHKCPNCKKNGLITKQTIIKTPTYETPGKMIIEKTCKYCSFYEKKIETIPKLLKSTYSGNVTSDSFSFPDDNSNIMDNSSDFNGFGGGSSGGAGASGKW